MPPMATSPPTWRCAWRSCAGKPPRELAQAIVAALDKDPAVERVEIAGAGFINFYLAAQAQADVVRRIHEPAMPMAAMPRARAARCWWSSCRPTPPVRCMWAMAGMARMARASPTCWMPTAMPCIASTTSTMPAGRWTSSRSACGCVTWKLCGEEFRFPANGYKGEYVREIAAQLLEQAGQMLVRPEAQVFLDLPPDEPDGGDKEAFIDAVITRAKELIGEVDFREIAELALKIIIADMENDLRRVRRDV